MKTQVYIPKLSQELQLLYADILESPSGFPTIYDQLSGFADKLWQAYRQGSSLIQPILSNNHPAFLGQQLSKKQLGNIKFADIQLSIAREHGYEDWEAVDWLGKVAIDYGFEEAIDLMLAGEEEELRIRLTERPALVHTHSQYPHAAYLLHYLGSNGVELRRQVVPKNLADIARMLREFGADPQVGMNVYGGKFDAWALYSSSAHPYDAGLVEN